MVIAKSYIGCCKLLLKNKKTQQNYSIKLFKRRRKQCIQKMLFQNKLRFSVIQHIVRKQNTVNLSRLKSSKIETNIAKNCSKYLFYLEFLYSKYIARSSLYLN